MLFLVGFIASVSTCRTIEDPTMARSICGGAGICRLGAESDELDSRACIRTKSSAFASSVRSSAASHSPRGEDDFEILDF